MDTSPDGYGKWRRLGSGIALLVSVQAADFFGQGAVDILARLGVDTLAFGTEEVLDYQKIADLYTEQGAEMEKFVENLPDSLPIPRKPKQCGRNLQVLIFRQYAQSCSCSCLCQSRCWTQHQTASDSASGRATIL